MEGILIYAKLSVCGDEPADVLNYACEHADFPHEPTSDQFFSESQFECYRSRGYHIVQNALSGTAVACPNCVSEVFNKLAQQGVKAATQVQGRAINAERK